ncbi:MAG: DUF916 domain-containing protein [bacterium]|nr:DUF916 domain-containing protein [bacterium]
MRKLSTISKITAAASLGSLLLTPITLAQESTNNNKTTGIEVSSPLYEFNLDPGDNQQDIIKIKNVGNQKTTYYPIVVDFKSNNTDGTPVFLNVGEENSTYSLTKWIKFTQEAVTLEPGKSEAFNFNITVPTNGEAGGHYGAILFSTEAATVAGTGVGLINQTGALILVRVSGDTKESATITTFKTSKPNYPTTHDVKLNLTISNSGNVHVAPKGNITITNIFGGKVAVIPVNEAGGNILPGSTRNFELAWKDLGFKIGLYKAKIDLVYGQTSKTLSAQTSFWIIPWKAIGIASAVLVVLLVALFFAIRRYNAWIISRSKQQSNSHE